MKTKLQIGMWMMCVAALAQPRMKLFNGELVVVLRTNEHPGTIRLNIKDSKGKLKAKTLEINTK